MKRTPDTSAWKRAQVHRRRRAHRLGQVTPLLTVAIACLLAAGSLSSCAPEPPPVSTGPEPPTGIPAIRVLLTPSPVQTATLSTTGGYRLLVDGRLLSESGNLLDQTVVSREGGTWRFAKLAAPGRRMVVKAVGRSVIHLAGTSYRGALHFLPRGQDGFVIVNHVPFDSYLAGVLPRELIPGWHLETYRAQAIAARTFAMYHKTTFGRTHDYDLGDSTSWQVYGGFTAETDKAIKAVRSTRGQVMLYGPRGRERIFLAQYSACNGGYVNGAHVIRDARKIGVLAGGQKDDDGRRCPRFQWAPVRISKADIHQALYRSYRKARALGAVKEIRVASQTPYGRAVWLDIVGAAGQPLRIRAEDLRLSLLRSRRDVPAARRLYSMNCKIRDLGDAIEFHDGRGFGHGVGLSQWGAEDKARRGWTAEKILEFYYPGAKIFRTYPAPRP